MRRRIDYRATHPSEAALILWERHGRHSWTIASNRCDGSDNFAVRSFYEEVMRELEDIEEQRAQ